MAHRRTHSRDAFTLVELLVVLGIIAIVTALLIPSLQAARAQANRTRCLSNIREIGQGIAVYLHDFRQLPPMEPLPQYLPQQVYTVAYYATTNNGLLSLKRGTGFNRFYLTCPQGWASGGDGNWYDGKGLSSNGSTFMDYAYWVGRYPPVRAYFDVRAESFTYNKRDTRAKIMVTDVVPDLSGANPQAQNTIGRGNHSGNRLTTTRMTYGPNRQLPVSNVIGTSGMSVLFSDYHAAWFPPSKLTQQTSGLCYPPVDQW
jgi:prepilin-type N-terminal cleavage/methylation domain-containing protein